MKNVIFILMLVVALVFCALWAKELAYGANILSRHGDIIGITTEEDTYGYTPYMPLLDSTDGPGLEIDAEAGDFIIDSNCLVIFNDWMDEAMDLTFCMGNTRVVFTWTDSQFDVIYDVNDLTGAAKTFFDSMKPHLNAHIKDAAEKLNRR